MNKKDLGDFESILNLVEEKKKKNCVIVKRVARFYPRSESSIVIIEIAKLE